MKCKHLLLIAFSLMVFTAQAETKTIKVETAGTLSTLIQGDDLNVIDLTLTGNINKADIAFIRQNMKVETLDLKDANIVAYSETVGETTIEYPANEFPANVFQKKDNDDAIIPLKKIIFPASMTSVGSYAFNSSSQSQLETVDFSNCSNLETIKGYAFEFCNKITEIDLSGHANLKSIEEYGFGQTGAKTINLEGCSALESIGERAFYQSYECTALNLKGCTALKTIGNRAFLNLSKNSSKTEDYNLVLDFSPCTSLETIQESGCQSAKAVAFILPASVKELQKNAFYLCTNAQYSRYFCKLPELGSSALKSLYKKKCYVLPGNKADYENAGFEDVEEFDATGIKSIASSSATGKAYSITGQPYNGNGIRIIGGKKYSK
ncbi:MAG: leucine-rich repeat domain-containing protein [Prevotella sp.]|nr:leucine-rich repeat domain-containing protein [Prevotella sp.]